MCEHSTASRNSSVNIRHHDVITSHTCTRVLRICNTCCSNVQLHCTIEPTVARHAYVSVPAQDGQNQLRLLRPLGWLHMYLPHHERCCCGPLALGQRRAAALAAGRMEAKHLVPAQRGHVVIEKHSSHTQSAQQHGQWQDRSRRAVWCGCSPVAKLVAGGGKQLPKLPLVRQHCTRLQVEAPETSRASSHQATEPVTLECEIARGGHATDLHSRATSPG
jgi:hypothetical protein